MSHIKSVHKDYDGFIIDVPELVIPDEGITLIQGESGSGKSSFLRLLMGLDSCVDFSWVFKGEDLALLKPQDRRLGVVFQSLELFPHMTALENIQFHAKARKISKTDFDKQMNPFFDLSRMRVHLNKKVSLLSGGEQQRVALLRAIAGRPRLLLLDEPFSSLDEKLKEDLKTLLLMILDQEKIPCIMVSHDDKDRAIAKKRIEFCSGKIAE